MKQIPRFEEEVIETLEPRQMLGKSLCSNIVRTWTETFVDETTGENVQVERNEILIQKAVVDKKLASSIQFYIDEGSINKPVRLSNTPRNGEYCPNHRYRPMLVKVHDLQNVGVICWADTLEHAQIVVADFIEQVSEGAFSIGDVTDIPATVIDDPEAYERQDEKAAKLPLLLNPLRYYTVNVIFKEAGTPYPFVNPSEEAKLNLCFRSFVCQADSFEPAQKIISPEITKIAYKERGWTAIETHWDRGTQFKAGVIVPKPFCDKYHEYFINNNK